MGGYALVAQFLQKLSKKRAELLRIGWLLQALRCPFDGSWGAGEPQLEGDDSHKEDGQGRRDSFHWMVPPPLTLLKNMDHISGGNLLSYHEMSSSTSSCILLRYSFQNNKSESNVWSYQSVLSFSITSTIPSSLFFVLYSCIVQEGKYRTTTFPVSASGAYIWLRYETELNLVYTSELIYCSRLCDLVITVNGYRPRGLVFASRPYQIFWEVVCLERKRSISWCLGTRMQAKLGKLK
jgi:hypothetical protein